MKKLISVLLMTCWTLMCFGAIANAVRSPISQESNIPHPGASHPDHQASSGQGFIPLKAAIQDTDPGTGMIPAAFVSHEFGDEGAFAIIVEKSSQTLILYDMSQQPREMFRIRCSTGKNFGPKTLSGDAKTPEGVYFFTKEHDEKYLTPVYGVKAFPTDYPNLLDRLAERTGSAIWLHGTDKPLKPYDSNGCIAVENSNILSLAPFITLNRTPVIIVETLHYRPEDVVREEAAAVGNLLTYWQKSIETAAYEAYVACYDAGRSVPSWWGTWVRTREEMLSNHTPIRIEAKNIAVYRHRNTFVTIFDQYVRAGGTTLWVGTNKLFLEHQDGQLVILGDIYQASSEISQNDPLENPLTAVSRALEDSLGIASKKSPSPTVDSTVDEDAVPIEQWLENWLAAWSSNNFRAYGDFYADDFSSRGMDKNAWIDYKRKINRKYRFIHLAKKDLVLTPSENQLIVSFTQEYECSAFRSVGTKKLVLIRQDNSWKIYRETWEKM